MVEPTAPITDEEIAKTNLWAERETVFGAVLQVRSRIFKSIIARIEADKAEIARLREAFVEITGLSIALRQGGPDMMDLEDLSNSLEGAIYIANAALNKEGE